MTVIAWDGKFLAADKRAYDNGTVFTTTKILRVKGHLIGSTGDNDSGIALKEWFKNGADPDKWPECQKDKDRYCRFIVITPTGKIMDYCREPFPTIIEDEFYAWGSGGDSALGAMAMGASARKAVEIACNHESGCGNGITVLRL